jgi:sugar phosphate isomerase/epimerase
MNAMSSRREFLASVGSALAIGGLAVQRLNGATAPRAATGTIGLQLWSLREYLPKDLDGTLAKVRAMGFSDVEGAGLYGRTVQDFRAALDKAGLRCQSAHMGFERLRDDLSGALQEAKALGATWVVCPWIAHGDAFTRDDALNAAKAFDRFGAAARDAGLLFSYHCHGYEFVTSPEGTLFETLAQATDPALVSFQIDVFHALYGGADPAALIERYQQRVTSLHLKDLKKGVKIVPGTAVGPADVDVPLGTGQVDMVAVLRAAAKAGVSLSYVEDESADPLDHIPRSLAYLRSVTV